MFAGERVSGKDDRVSLSLNLVAVLEPLCIMGEKGGRGSYVCSMQYLEDGTDGNTIYKYTQSRGSLNEPTEELLFGAKKNVMKLKEIRVSNRRGRPRASS